MVQTPVTLAAAGDRAAADARGAAAGTGRLRERARARAPVSLVEGKAVPRRRTKSQLNVVENHMRWTSAAVQDQSQIAPMPETIWSVSAQVIRGSPRESARQLCMKYGTTIPLADAVRQELPGFMQRAVASAPNLTLLGVTRQSPSRLDFRQSVVDLKRIGLRAQTRTRCARLITLAKLIESGARGLGAVSPGATTAPRLRRESPCPRTQARQRRGTLQADRPVRRPEPPAHLANLRQPAARRKPGRWR